MLIPFYEVFRAHLVTSSINVAASKIPTSMVVLSLLGPIICGTIAGSAFLPPHGTSRVRSALVLWY